jgi:hypothetical protein
MADSGAAYLDLSTSNFYFRATDFWHRKNPVFRLGFALLLAQSNLFFSSYLPQHFLNFFPLPHGQGSFRPTLFSLTIGICFISSFCEADSPPARFAESRRADETGWKLKIPK